MPFCLKRIRKYEECIHSSIFKYFLVLSNNEVKSVVFTFFSLKDYCNAFVNEYVLKINRAII
mgnify:CR=1 FL=1